MIETNGEFVSHGLKVMAEFKEIINDPNESSSRERFRVRTVAMTDEDRGGLDAVAQFSAKLLAADRAFRRVPK